MICKKCNSFVADEDNFCNVCGKNLKSNSNIKKFIGIIAIICGVAACGIYIYFNRPLQPDDYGYTTTESPLPPENGSAAATPTPTPTPAPTATADFSKDINDVWNILSRSYAGVTEFMDDYSYTPFISSKGYLFDVAANRAIKMIDLTSSDKLGEEYAEENVYFFYLRPADFAEFDEVEFGDSQELTVFTGYEIKTGVALYSRKYAGIIYRESLNKILTEYSGDNGTIVRVPSSDQKYSEIVESVISYNPNNKDLEVRYMAADDKYAVAVLSPKSDSTNLMGYVLEKKDTSYAIIDDNFEKYPKAIVGVNSVVPYMSIELMPKFDVSGAGLQPSVLYSGIAVSLKNQGEITDDDLPVDFVSGTNEYFYLVLSSGIKFLGTNKSGTEWNVTRVDSWASAELILTMAEREPPLYILRQE